MEFPEFSTADSQLPIFHDFLSKKKKKEKKNLFKNH